MGTRVFAGALLLACAPVLPAAYSNLIATGDGNSVYFQVRTGFAAARWFVVRGTDSGPVVEAVKDSLQPVQDVDSSGTVFASAFYGTRECGFAGSTCFLAPACQAAFTVAGPGFTTGNPNVETFARLDRAGALAWAEQSTTCPNPVQRSPVPKSGLFAVGPSGLMQVAPANGRLANRRQGRRLITDSGRVLTFQGIQMQWLDAAGTHPIRHVAGAFEAVADAGGGNIVYVEDTVGELHWIAAVDEDLGFAGSAPALSDDGSTLVFLAPDQSLEAYDRAAGTVRRLGSDTFLEFTLGGNAVFAVTWGNRLVRIDLATGDAATWLEPFPEIQSADAPGAGLRCPLICYTATDPGVALSGGMILTLRGTYLDQPGWRARIGDLDGPLNTVSDQAAWWQVPSDVAETAESVEIYNPAMPITFHRAAHVGNVVVCSGTLHEDFSRPVSADDPAVPGEIVHVSLTGLHGVEAVPDEIPNPADHFIAVADPPEMADPGAADVVWLGLAPGAIGMERLDLRIRRGSSETELFSGIDSFGCTQPPVGTPDPTPDPPTRPCFLPRGGLCSNHGPQEISRGGSGRKWRCPIRIREARSRRSAPC